MKKSNLIILVSFLAILTAIITICFVDVDRGYYKAIYNEEKIAHFKVLVLDSINGLNITNNKVGENTIEINYREKHTSIVRDDTCFLRIKSSKHYLASNTINCKGLKSINVRNSGRIYVVNFNCDTLQISMNNKSDLSLFDFNLD